MRLLRGEERVLSMRKKESSRRRLSISRIRKMGNSETEDLASEREKRDPERKNRALERKRGL